eukprot:758643-Hanusia_phi.AAC.3
MMDLAANMRAVASEPEELREKEELCDTKDFPRKPSREKQLKCLQSSIHLVLSKSIIITATGDIAQL